MGCPQALHGPARSWCFCIKKFLYCIDTDGASRPIPREVRRSTFPCISNHHSSYLDIEHLPVHTSVYYLIDDVTLPFIRIEEKSPSTRASRSHVPSCTRAIISPASHPFGWTISHSSYPGDASARANLNVRLSTHFYLRFSDPPWIFQPTPDGLKT